MVYQKCSSMFIIFCDYMDQVCIYLCPYSTIDTKFYMGFKIWYQVGTLGFDFQYYPVHFGFLSIFTLKVLFQTHWRPQAFLNQRGDPRLVLHVALLSCTYCCKFCTLSIFGTPSYPCTYCAQAFPDQVLRSASGVKFRLTWRARNASLRIGLTGWMDGGTEY